VNRSPIEVIWDYLETEKNKRNPTNLTELWNALQNICHNIPVRVLQSFARNMRKIIMALNKAKPAKQKYCICPADHKLGGLQSGIIN